MKYSESALKYKKEFKSVSDLVSETDETFKKKYFRGGKSEKVFSSPFIPGQIYSFYYNTDSELSEKRPFINRNPIVLCTDTFRKKEYGTVLKGIDLVTVPPPYKIQILSKIYDSFSNTIERNEEASKNGGAISPIQLKDSLLERALNGTGYKKSVFGFKASFMQEIKILDLEDWYKIPYLRYSEIEGLDLQGIYSEYESKLI
jgi:hypothetical protein